MTSYNEELGNPGFYVFKPNKNDTKGEVFYSAYGAPIDPGKIIDEGSDPAISYDDRPDSTSLKGILTGRQKWLDKNKDMVKELHNALDSLPMSERQAIDLLFFQQLSFGKASGIMAISKGACQSYYSRAVKELQQYFQNLALRMDIGREGQNDKG